MKWIDAGKKLPGMDAGNCLIEGLYHEKFIQEYNCADLSNKPENGCGVEIEFNLIINARTIIERKISQLEVYQTSIRYFCIHGTYTKKMIHKKCLNFSNGPRTLREFDTLKYLGKDLGILSLELTNITRWIPLSSLDGCDE